MVQRQLTTTATSSATAAPSPLGRRAALLALLLVAVFTSVGIYSVFLRYEIVGTGYLPRTATFLIFLVIVLNLALLRFARRLALSDREVLVAFAVLMVVAALPGQEFSQHVYLNLMGLTYYSTPDITPPDLYQDLLRTPIVPSTDRLAPVIRWAYEGKPPGAATPFAAWLPTLALWTPFWLALYWTIACWSLLFFPRWEEQEKLVFPLVQVPVELTEGLPVAVPAVLRNKLFWAGFFVSTALYVLKGLHTYFPSVPDINLQKNIGQVFAGGPAVVYNGLPLHVYPEMIGIAYLLSAEVGFSVWFFYHFRLFQHFIRLALGFRQNPGSFFEAQTIGGYIMLAAAMLWSARGYLDGVIRHALGGSGETLPGADRGHPYRLAVWGFVFGLAFMLYWCTQAGMTLTWAAMQWVVYPFVALVVARVVAEAGMFIYSAPFRLNQVLVEMFGPKAIGRENILMLFATSWSEIRGTATQNAPYWFQALKLVSAVDVSRVQFLWLAMAAIALTIGISHVLSLHVIYTWSVPKLGWWPSGSSLNTTRTLVRYLQNPRRYGATEWSALVAGGLFTWFLVYMRQRFTWWPFHPLGYVTWLGWPTHRYWFSVAIGWAWKVVTVRFFGFKAFGVMRPLAFGLVTGLCFILSVWLFIHLVWPGPPLLIE